MTTRSRCVSVVVKNLTTALTTISEGIKVTHVLGANRGPPVKIAPGTLEKLDEMQGIQQTRMSTEQNKEMLFQHLDLSHLEGWSIENQAATYAALAEYHDFFLWNLESWVVLTWQSMRLELLMMSPLRRYSEEFPQPR